MRAPLSFAWRNVLFGRDAEDAWALYRLHTASYAELATAARIDRLAALAGYAVAAEADFQILRVSRTWSTTDYAANAFAMADREHARPEALAALLAEHGETIDAAHTAVAEVFLVVHLGEPSGSSRGFSGLLGDLSRLVGLRDARAISQRGLDDVLDREVVAYQRAGAYLDAERATTDELQWLIRRATHRGVSDPALDPHWQPQALVLDAEDEDGGRRFRPLEADVMRLLDEPMSVARDQLEVGDSHQAILVVGALPETTVFPDRWPS